MSVSVLYIHLLSFSTDPWPLTWSLPRPGINAESVVCPEYVVIWHLNWRAHSSVATWIHGGTAGLYVNWTIMVLLYNAVQVRQTSHSVYTTKNMGEMGIRPNMMYFMGFCWWHRFCVTMYLLCNGSKTRYNVDED